MALGQGELQAEVKHGQDLEDRELWKPRRHFRPTQMKVASENKTGGSTDTEDSEKMWQARLQARGQQEFGFTW